MKMLFLTMVVVASVMVATVNGETYSSAKTLKNTVMASYDRDVIPVLNQSHVLTVNLTLRLFSILDIDQVRGAVQYDIELKCEWYDQMITWDPANHGGITDLYLTSKDVWTPPVVIGNPVEFSKLEETWMQVYYQSNGHAVMSPITTIGTSCSFYMAFWPFDKQKCQIDFFIFGSKNTKLTLDVTEEAVNTMYYMKNSEWTLLEDSITYEIIDSCGITIVKFYFKIIRQADFYMLTVILPITGMVALTSMVFMLPSESGERVSYSITIMLSLAVFLTVTADALPKTADPAPMLCIYILCSMVLCIVSLILVIWNLRIYHRSESIPISRWYKSIVRVSRWKCKWRKSDDVQPMEHFHIDEMANSPIKKKPMDGWTSAEKRHISDQIDEASDELKHLTWHEVSEAIDKVLFYSLIVVSYIPSIAVIAYIATGSDFPEE